ncbi:hypothetical protein ACWGPW_19380 [Paenibacillus chitinolyticus]
MLAEHDNRNPPLQVADERRSESVKTAVMINGPVRPRLIEPALAVPGQIVQSVHVGLDVLRQEPGSTQRLVHWHKSDAVEYKPPAANAFDMSI